MKREEKLERRLIRSDEKRSEKEGAYAPDDEDPSAQGEQSPDGADPRSDSTDPPQPSS